MAELGGISQGEVKGKAAGAVVAPKGLVVVFGKICLFRASMSGIGGDSVVEEVWIDGTFSNDEVVTGGRCLFSGDGLSAPDIE